MMNNNHKIKKDKLDYYKIKNVYSLIALRVKGQSTKVKKRKK